MKGRSILMLLLGAGGLIGGAIVSALRPAATPYGYGAVTVGAVALIAFLTLERDRLGTLARQRQVKYGANTLAYSVIVVTIVVALNWVLAQHPHSVDLTDAKLYTLSEQTTKALARLPRPVTVTAFFLDSLEKDDARDLLELYERQSKKLQVEFVNPERDPLRTEQMGIKYHGTTVFESDDQRILVEEVSEEAFTNALLNVTRDERLKVYLVEGHGELDAQGGDEPGISQAQELLISKGYDVDRLALGAVAEVPRDASLLVLAGPQSRLPEHDLTLLDRFLSEGGRALILLDPNRDGGLRDILAARGVELRDDVVIDPTVRLAGGPVESILVWGDLYRRSHPITERLAYESYFSLARSVSPVSDADVIEADTLFECSGAGWAEVDMEGRISFDPERDRRGPISLAVASSWTSTTDRKDSSLAEPAPGPTEAPSEGGEGADPVDVDSDESPESAQVEESEPDVPAEGEAAPNSDPPDPETPAVPISEPLELAEDANLPGRTTLDEPRAEARHEDGRLVVVGDSDFLSDVILPASPGNEQLFLSMVGWLSETEELIAVPPKKPGNYQLRLTREQNYLINIVALFMVPGAILVYGLTTWWRRRRA